MFRGLMGLLEHVARSSLRVRGPDLWDLELPGAENCRGLVA